MVQRLLGLKTAPQADAADALAAALCHLHRARVSEPARAATAAGQQLEALLARRRPGAEAGQRLAALLARRRPA
jgi:hypothetical protein